MHRARRRARCAAPGARRPARSRAVPAPPAPPAGRGRTTPSIGWAAGRAASSHPSSSPAPRSCLSASSAPPVPRSAGWLPARPAPRHRPAKEVLEAAAADGGGRRRCPPRRPEGLPAAAERLHAAAQRPPLADIDGGLTAVTAPPKADASRTVDALPSIRGERRSSADAVDPADRRTAINPAQTLARALAVADGALHRRRAHDRRAAPPLDPRVPRAGYAPAVRG